MSIIAWKNVMIIQKYDGKIVKSDSKGIPFISNPWEWLHAAQAPALRVSHDFRGRMPLPQPNEY